MYNRNDAGSNQNLLRGRYHGVDYFQLLDSNKDYVDDLFLGNTNTHDILNTQLSVSNRLITRLRKGQMYEDGYQLVGDATCEPFFDRFENVLAGWATTFTVEIFNDLNYC